MYKLIIGYKDSVDLSIGFIGDQNRRQWELTDNKNLKGKFHAKNLLKDILGFAEHQQKATNGFGYKITLTRNNVISVSNTETAAINGKN